jgi:hypothetical protein
MRSYVMKKLMRPVLRSCGIAGILVCAAVIASASPGVARAAEENPNPTPVDTSTNPKATLLNARNPLAVHAGPGEPNVGSIYIPPTPSGKEKKAKEGQTENKVMGAETGEK